MEPLVCRKGAAVSTCPDQPSYIAEDALSNQPPTAVASSSVPKGRTALLWTVGSTILSVIGFIALALFEQYNEALSELRGDLKHFNEISATFTKKEDLQRFRDHVKDVYKELHSVNVLRAQLEQELRVSEKVREEMSHDMQRLRERLAFVEGQHAVTASAQGPSSAKTNGPK